MIEDALKSTRNLHRLILAVSLVTLVFSLSLRPPDQQRKQKAIIDALIDIDFSSYDVWLKPKLDEAIASWLEPATEPVVKSLESGNYPVFLREDIVDALRTPAHIGKLLIEELILKDVSTASLTQLNALNGFALAANVQITVPRVEGVVTELTAFLEDNPGAGKRIANAQVTISPYDSVGESFLPGKTVTGTLYFELVDAVAVGSAPVFQVTFDADIIEIPHTSFLAWLEQAELSPIVEIRAEKVIFAGSLAEAPRGFFQEKLGTLSLRLADEIKSAGPEKRTASILGTQVPGLLIVLAAPLTLMALMYYLVSHTAHLARLARRHSSEMAGFAWLPITMTEWPIPGTTRYIRGNIFELLMSLAVLPIVSLTVMYWKLDVFGGISLPTKLLIAGSILWILVFWRSVRREIEQIRQEFRKAEILEATPDNAVSVGDSSKG